MKGTSNRKADRTLNYSVKLRAAAGASILIALLAAGSRALAFEDRKPSQAVAAPDLQITQVRTISPSPVGVTGEVEIRWTAQVPRLTTVDGFDVTLEVKYSDGSKITAHSDQLKPHARSVIVRVPSKPRPGVNATLKDYRASVKARFIVTSTLTVSEQVSAAQGLASRSSTGSTSASQPEVFITSARLAGQSCAPGRCIDVKWTATSPRNIAITEFRIAIDAVHKGGARASDSKIVAGSDREARLQVGAASSDIESIKVSLLTTFSFSDFKTAVREGAF